MLEMMLKNLGFDPEKVMGGIAEIRQIVADIHTALTTLATQNVEILARLERIENEQAPAPDDGTDHAGAGPAA